MFSPKAVGVNGIPKDNSVVKLGSTKYFFVMLQYNKYY